MPMLGEWFVPRLPPPPAWRPTGPNVRRIWVSRMSRHEAGPRAGASNSGSKQEASPAHRNLMHTTLHGLCCTSHPPLVTTVGSKSPPGHPLLSGEPQRREVTTPRSHSKSVRFQRFVYHSGHFSAQKRGSHLPIRPKKLLSLGKEE